MIKKSSLCILLMIVSISPTLMPYVVVHGIKTYLDNELPFDISYSDWVAKYWNWDFSLPFDPQTNVIAGLEENGCLIHRESSMVMLADTAFGGIWNQNCTISRNEGILIPIWTGECNAGEKDCLDQPFEKLSEAARGFDLGKIRGEVKVDNVSIARLDVTDYETNLIHNVTEVFTTEFNATVPENSHVQNEKYGVHPAAAHGWFVFLKPLQPGNHIVYYQNSVEPTTLSGAGNSNTAQFTYHMKVQ